MFRTTRTGMRISTLCLVTRLMKVIEGPALIQLQPKAVPTEPLN